MKTRVLALVALCAAGAALAQTPPPPPPPPGQFAEHQMTRLAVLLDLTDGQKAQVKAILDGQRGKMRAQFEQSKASGTRPTFEQMKAAHEQNKQETEQQLSAVLTPEQLNKFKVLMEDHGFGPGGPRGRGPHGPPPGPPPPDAPQN